MGDEIEQTSLVSLFLHSKKALSHGQALCSRASKLSSLSAETLVSALALDAKNKWVAHGVIEQLSLAGAVSKYLVQQRNRMVEEARAWDSLRTERNQSLEAILESLGSQLVPPTLHQMSSGSSLFGSQHSLSDRIVIPPENDKKDSNPEGLKAKWKSLRDFVDEKAIEEAFENLDDDRNILDDIITSTVAHPATLNKRLTDIKNSLPTLPSPSQPLHQSLSEQEDIASEMASRLESLTAHYDQMSRALREEEQGQTLSTEDMEVFVRDTNVLPSIISELEHSVHSIEHIQEHITTFRDAAATCLESHHDVLSQLEALEATMDIMIQASMDVETEAASVHAALQSHHTSLQELEGTYHSYQLAYDHLILEMDRRSRYRSTVQDLIDSLTVQLDALRNDEVSARESFIAEHGSFLPDDLCPFVPDMPPKWFFESDGSEGAVNLHESVLLEAKKNLGFIDGELSSEQAII